MSQIYDIKMLWKKGLSISAIAREVGLDWKTVKKYIDMNDFSPTPPIVHTKASKLDPYKETIDKMLNEDQGVWFKQRHTAKRIYDILRDDYDYEGSYSIVQRYVRTRRRETGIIGASYQDLVWAPGTAQVDFGQADFMVHTEKERHHFLAVSFPYSNMRYAQLFRGETAECVSQGLQDVFEHIGGVPQRLVFDNATGIGRRVGSELKLAELFDRFKTHYGFAASFCNPESGHEKGNVENAVGTLRRNLFVPVPSVDDLVSYNADLFAICEQFCDAPHYRKLENQLKLFEEDRKACAPLPPHPFDVRRYEICKTDKKGFVKIEGCHLYSTRPDLGSTEVIVGLGAHFIEIQKKDGTRVARHKRQFGKQRTETIDPGSFLTDLAHKPGAWLNSVVRQNVNEDLQHWVDGLDKSARVNVLGIWAEVSEKYDFEASASVMDWFVREGKEVTLWDALSVAERITGFGLDTPPASGQSLTEYDEAFLGIGHSGGDEE